MTPRTSEVTDLVDRCRIRVEVARMLGDMPDYVDDVPQLLDVIDRYRHAADHIDAGIDAMNEAVARLKAQAAMTDTAESTAHDRQLLFRGSVVAMDAFRGAVE